MPPAGALADGWCPEDGARGRPVDDALSALPPALCQGPDEDPAGDVSVSLCGWRGAGSGVGMPPWQWQARRGQAPPEGHVAAARWHFRTLAPGTGHRRGSHRFGAQV